MRQRPAPIPDFESVARGNDAACAVKTPRNSTSRYGLPAGTTMARAGRAVVNNAALARIALTLTAATWFSAAAIAQTATSAAREAAPIRPDLLYHNYCSVCHGDKGDGRSRARTSLVPPPRDFTEEKALQSLSRETMVAITTHGKPGTAMVGWSTQLSPREVEALIDYIRATFMAPRRDPAFARGRAVYAQACAACHGRFGQGSSHGPMSTRDLSTPQARLELSRDRMLDMASTESHRRLAGAGARLADTDFAAAVDFIRIEFMATQTASVSGTQAHGGRAGDAAHAPAAAPQAHMTLPFANGVVGNARRGKAFYDANCATCHGVKGDAQGPRAYFINPKPRNFLTEKSRATYNRPALFAAVSVGSLGSEMPAWNKVIDEQQIADVAEYVFSAFIRTPGARAQR